MQMKYSDLLADWLYHLGYRKCFFVAGGQIMHLLESVRHRFECRPFVHETAAVIATEYFNETAEGEKAFALVTGGPGLTNIITSLAGAYLESREILVLGGTGKAIDLSGGTVRQRGIQEIDGVSIAKPVTVLSERLTQTIDRAAFTRIVQASFAGRPGPVFLEVCLDVQGRPVDKALRKELEATTPPAPTLLQHHSPQQSDKLAALLKQARRPVLLLGGGVSRKAVKAALPKLDKLGIPLMTTWNGADRVGADHPLYFGRPNTWGQRYSNIILQQADLIIALGTRLGMQQTGFNWQQFGAIAKLVQVDIDQAELDKGHPRVDVAIQADADGVLADLAQMTAALQPEWLDHCRKVKELLPLSEAVNQTVPGYIAPHAVASALSDLTRADDIVIPCSSGSAFTVMMQVFRNRLGQKIVTNKGLASMGYGLSGAMGAALANPDKRVVLVEGDGGFAQNLQELGTVVVNNLNLKMFIFDDNGYASIRMTQRNYFGGNYVGCDTSTGLGLPNWEKLFAAYDIPVLRLGEGYESDAAFGKLFNSHGPAGFIVPVNPEHTYFPKITSRVTETGGMESNPLHMMTPDLPDDVQRKVLRYWDEHMKATETA